jgi:Undecaprenyl-phosphate galactose phosphotransferase WbaP
MIQAATDAQTTDLSRVAPRHLRQHHERLKRIFDLLGALLIIFFLLPLFLAILIAVATSGRPVFFRHQRIGRDGIPFDCLKFRSMVPNAEKVLYDYLQSSPQARREWEKNFKLRNDPRITRVGRFVRKTSLDEIPQLLNVIAGDMSLVGPRPIVAAEVARYGEDIEHYYSCKPGITGPWQVSGRNDTSYAQRVRLDVEYARHGSLHQDVVILGRTIRVVLLGSGAY